MVIGLFKLIGILFLCIIGVIGFGLYVFACAWCVSILNVRKSLNQCLLLILCFLVTPFLFGPISIWICYKRESKLFEKEC